MRTTIKKFATDIRVRIGYVTAFILLLISYLLTIYANHDFLNETKLVNHTHRVMINTERLLSSIKDAESAFRGYIVTRDISLLEPYYQSKKLTDSFFTILKKETSDNLQQQQKLSTINQLIQKKFQIFTNSMDYYSTRNFEITDSLKVQAYFGHAIMERIKSIGKEIQDSEERLLKIRKDQMNVQFNIMNNIIMASLLLAFFLVVYGFFTYAKENIARRKADEKVNGYQEQLKQRINDLDQANKELIQMRSLEKLAVTGRIARTIAHEVRNPLTNINLAADQIQIERNNRNNGDTNNMLEMIHRNSNRINQLITALLESTKATELSTQIISINIILDETLELARDRLQLNRISVSKQYTNDNIDVNVDKEKIKIAFLNIIVNAIESMEPEKGELHLSTFLQDSACIVKIKDNGAGIDEESMSKLFEPYFTNKPNGTGLGLTNTQNIIFTHNGQISAESKLGEGTTFTITLNFS
jgi:signal transduction histidine kinase